MSSKDQNTPNEQVLQESKTEQGQQQVEAMPETVDVVDPRAEAMPETVDVVDPRAEAMPETVDVVDPRDKRIAELETALSQAQQRERDSVLRAKAETENVRRRGEQDVKKAHKFALERFIGELLPVIDNLERALDMSDKTNGELASTIEGIELTLKSLLDAVRKFGLDVVNDTDVPFNPEVHQAMTMLESDEYEPNYVMMVLQKGYTLNGRLIRPAMVAVSKAKN